jgi:hypothetical protein
LSSQIIPPFPCKNCPDRHTACHDKCEKYLSAKRARDKKKEAIRQEKIIDGYTIERVLDKEDRAAKRRRDIAGVRKTSR